jgi:carboxypeptidase PM20D1
MKKIFLALFLGLLVFVSYLFYNAVKFESKQPNTESIKQIPISKKSVENFSKALQIKTISPENPVDFDSTQFRLFADFLEKTYPLVDSLTEKKVFNEFSFLYKLNGTDSSLKPMVLMAHLDVVPVIEKNLTDWKQDPFAGKVVDKVIWGRGTIDDKIAVVSIMEALELLLQENFQPKRTIYISFGHDEEIGGVYGAKTIANYLKAQNVEAEFVLDEGMAITQGLIPGIEQEVALIGTAEKGFLSLELSVKIQGGHSSAPDKETAIDVLATAIATLKKNPLPSKLSPPVQEFIKYIGAEMPYPNKLVFANASLFELIILSIYEQSGSGNALVRTTTAPTIFNSGVKENIIPQFASATVNFRILPEESIESVIEHVKNTINDERIVIKEGDFSAEASKVASINSLGYQAIQKTISEVYPEVLISPNLVIGATDSRFFESISDNVYKFLPIHVNKENLKCYHGINERIPVKDFEDTIRFYIQLIKNSTL